MTGLNERYKSWFADWALTEPCIGAERRATELPCGGTVCSAPHKALSDAARGPLSTGLCCPTCQHAGMQASMPGLPQLNAQAEPLLQNLGCQPCAAKEQVPQMHLPL